MVCFWFTFKSYLRFREHFDDETGETNTDCWWDANRASRVNHAEPSKTTNANSSLKKKRRITGPIWPTCRVCVGLVSQLSGATLGQSPPWSKGVSCTTGTVLTNGWLYSENKYSPIFWHRSLKHAHKLALASHLCHGEFWYSGNTMWSRRASSTIT